jgi:hypothetical protein
MIAIYNKTAKDLAVYCLLVLTLVVHSTFADRRRFPEQ